MTLGARLYGLSYSLIGQHLPGRLGNAHGKLWLGLLSDRDLDAINLRDYGRGRGFDDEAFNNGGLFPWEEAWSERLIGCHRIAVAGAGGGREVLALALKGHEAWGFDPVERLVRAGQRHLERSAEGAALRQSPPGDIPEGWGDFDAVIVGRGVYHHIPGRSKRVQFLRRCGSLAKPDSPFILGDVFLRDRSVDILSEAYLHGFTREELVGELNTAGLIDIEIRRTPCTDGGSLMHALARTPAGSAQD